MKKILRKLDKILFLGFFERKYRTYKVNRSVRFERGQLNYGFTLQYQKNHNSNINKLCDTYGSDKGEVNPSGNPYSWNSHNYADFYSLIFSLRRNDVRLVVECGLGTNNPNLISSMGVDGEPGASLRVWKDFFPNAQIIGCDIDNEILFEDERITSFHCDQTSQISIKKFCSNAKLDDDSVDIIIDDGLHNFFAGKCFFENMISSLRADGIYIIEDVTYSDMIKYKQYFTQLKHIYEARFVFLTSPLKVFGIDNNLICITKNEVQ